MKVLVTGGTGYIGSHTVVKLLEGGYEVAIADNLCNSKRVVLDRIEEISKKRPAFYLCDLRDEEGLKEIFSKENPAAVIHFAGLKAVGESAVYPLKYYDNNLCSTLTLLKVMEKFGVKSIVFSSSATVYGDKSAPPFFEDAPVTMSATNPYGFTKIMIEQILTDYAKAHHDFNAVILRYFNPVGSHPSGLIGEDPSGIPNNLAPYITQTLVGKREKLHVYGNDYPTPDGTCVRDYIHVEDLAAGHVAALKLFEGGEPCGRKVYNLGTGRGFSVMEVIDAFSRAAGRQVPYDIVARREGDIPESYADCKKAYRELGWKAEKTLDDMCEDALRWQEMNPNGYEE